MFSVDCNLREISKSVDEMDNTAKYSDKGMISNDACVEVSGDYNMEVRRLCYL